MASEWCECLVTQLCLMLCNLMGCSSPDSPVHGILRPRILKWIAIPFSRGSSWLREQTQISCFAGRLFTIGATREAQYCLLISIQGQEFILQPIWHCFYQLLIFCFQPINSSANNLSTKTLIQAFSSVQSLSHVQIFVTPWTAVCQASLSITNSWSLLKLMSIESVMPSNHLILCRPLFLPPSIFPSNGVFSSESVLHIRWPTYWSFSFSSSPSNDSGLISFRMDWLDLLAIQGTLKSLLQHHSSKASILWRSALFIVQLSHLYMTTGKTIALTRRTFVGKVMSLLFNMLSRLVIAFLPRSKHL